MQIGTPFRIHEALDLEPVEAIVRPWVVCTTGAARSNPGWLIISCLIATPISWYFLHQWLLQYEYRTPISWWVFAASSVGALMITLLTVSYQAVRAALMNPVRSLRTE